METLKKANFLQFCKKVYSCMGTSLHAVVSISALQIHPCCMCCLLLSGIPLCGILHGVFIPWLLDIWVIFSLAIMAKNCYACLNTIFEWTYALLSFGKHKRVGFLAFNSILTGGFLQKLTLVAGDFGQPKMNSFISLNTLQVITFSCYT